MISVFDETIITLAQAAAILPRRRAGKKTAVQTLYRWAAKGHRGVQLEVVKVGATTCTSKQALQRFFNQLTELDHQPVAPRLEPQQAMVESQLDAAGI